MKKVWCPMCRDFVEYEEETVMESFSTTTWAGKKRMGKYHKIYAHCPDCKTVINVPDIIDQNVRARAKHQQDFDALPEDVKKIAVGTGSFLSLDEAIEHKYA